MSDEEKKEGYREGQKLAKIVRELLSCPNVDTAEILARTCTMTQPPTPVKVTLDSVILPFEEAQFVTSTKIKSTSKTMESSSSLLSGLADEWEMTTAAAAQETPSKKKTKRRAP